MSDTWDTERKGDRIVFADEDTTAQVTEYRVGWTNVRGSYVFENGAEHGHTQYYAEVLMEKAGDCMIGLTTI